MPSIPLDFEAVREIARGLPDVQESLGARGWAFRVRGKMLACKAVHRSAEAGTLVVRIDFPDRAALIAADPNAFYVTAHYVDYPAILVRVSRISRDALSELLEKSRSYVTSGAPATPRGKSARSVAKRSSKKRTVRKRAMRTKRP